MTDHKPTAAELERFTTLAEREEKYGKYLKSKSPWCVFSLGKPIAVAGPLDFVVEVLEDKLNDMVEELGLAVSIYVTDLDRPRPVPMISPEKCHECRCHISPPCNACVDCGHHDNDDGCGDCETCPQKEE